MYSNNDIKVEEEKNADPSSSDNSFKRIMRESVTSKIIKIDDQSEHQSIFAKDPMAIIDNDHEEPYFEYYSKAYLNDEEYIAPPPPRQANTTRVLNNRLKLSTFLSPTPSEYIDQN